MDYPFRLLVAEELQMSGCAHCAVARPEALKEQEKCR